MFTETGPLRYSPFSPFKAYVDYNSALRKEAGKILATAEALTVEYSGLGPTPKEAVWKKNKATLWHYKSPVPKEERIKTPVMLNFAFMNDPVIWDLRHGGSFVEFMKNKGYDVYSLDCGVPGPEDHNFGFGEYVSQVMHRAAGKVKESAGSDRLTGIGWCQGAGAMSMQAARYPEDLDNLVLLTAGLDFSKKEDGNEGFMKQILDYHINEEWIDRVGSVNGGLIPGEFINMGAIGLKPYENTMGSTSAMYKKAEVSKDGSSGLPEVPESMWAVNSWMRRIKPMTQKAYEDLILKMYLKNDLAEGRFEVDGQMVKLQDIKASTLMLVATGDHIVTPPQSKRAFPLIGSVDKQLVEMQGGHVGIMVGKQGFKAWGEIDRFLAPRS